MSAEKPKWVLSGTTTNSGKTLFECTGCGAIRTAPTKEHDCADTPRLRFRLDPDLTDGEHYVIHDRADVELLELFAQWLGAAEPGETITIKAVMMTDREAEGLPDI